MGCIDLGSSRTIDDKIRQELNNAANTIPLHNRGSSGQRISGSPEIQLVWQQPQEIEC